MGLTLGLLALFLLSLPFEAVAFIDGVPQAPDSARPLMQTVLQYEGKASVVNHFSNRTDRDSSLLSCLGIGLGSSPKLNSHLEKCIAAALSTFDSQMLKEEFKVSWSHKAAVVPVYHRLASGYLLSVTDISEIGAIVERFASSPFRKMNEDGRTFLSRQLEIRLKNHLSQQEAFLTTVTKDSSVRFKETPRQSVSCPFRHSAQDSEVSDTARLLEKAMAESSKFSTFFINLWFSISRREYMLKQLREAALEPIFMVPGVDAHSIPGPVYEHLFAKDESVILAEGHFAAAIAHVQTWRLISERGDPFAIVLEDDVDVDSDIVSSCILSKVVETLSPYEWDVVLLDDYEEDMLWVNQRYKNKCIEVSKNQFLVRLSPPCAAGSTRGYLVSLRGARKLLKLVPVISRNMDVAFAELIHTGSLSAYSLRGAKVHGRPKLSRPSDISEFFLAFSKEENSVVFTYDPDHPRDCLKSVCPVYLGSSDPETKT